VQLQQHLTQGSTSALSLDTSVTQKSNGSGHFFKPYAGISSSRRGVTQRQSHLTNSRVCASSGGGHYVHNSLQLIDFHPHTAQDVCRNVGRFAQVKHPCRC